MKRFIKAVLILAGIWGLSGPAFAASPNILTYQGRLIQSGVPASGPQMVEIHLCPDVATPLGSCFSTINQGVNAASGLFKTTFTIPSGVNLASGVWWLNVSVNGTPLSPREQLTSSPFAAFASTASSLGVASGPGVFVSTNVGINTPNPAALLHVLGTSVNQARILVESSVASGNPGMIVKANTPAGNAFLLLDKADSGAGANVDFSESGAQKWQLAFRDSASQNRLDINQTSLGLTRMAFATDGRVGVGATAPIARLHVSSPSANDFDTILAVSTGTGPGSDPLRVMGSGQVAVSSHLAIGKPFASAAIDAHFHGADNGLRLNNASGGPSTVRLSISGTQRAFMEAATADAYFGAPGAENVHLRSGGQTRLFVQGGTGQVGVGTVSPTAGSALEVFGGSTTVTAFNMNGPHKVGPILTPAGGATLSVADYLVIPGCTGPCTITLPPASAATIGQVFIIISNSATNTVTVAPAGGDTQVGPTSVGTPGGRITVIGLTASSWVFAN